MRICKFARYKSHYYYYFIKDLTFKDKGMKLVLKESLSRDSRFKKKWLKMNIYA